MKWGDIGGWIGTGLVVLAYAFISNGLLIGTSITYLGMNLAGSVLLGINVFQKKAWAPLALQVLWVAISLVALAKVV